MLDGHPGIAALSSWSGLWVMELKHEQLKRNLCVAGSSKPSSI